LKSPVAKLLDLQTHLLRIDDRTAARSTMPPDVAKLDAAMQEKERAGAELRERAAAAENEKSEVDRELAEKGEQLQKYQGQLMQVRTNKEYSAMLNEIDAARKAVRTLEERTLDLEEKLEETKKELAARDEALPAERAEHEAKIGGWREFQAACDAEIAKLKAEVAEIEKGLPPRLLTQFRTIFGRRRGVAVCRISGPHCPACNVRLRPAFWQTIRLRSDREILTCESCQRILVFTEDEAAGS
jgi:uncharacterized protein